MKNNAPPCDVARPTCEEGEKKQMNDDGVDREWKRRAEIHRNPVPNFDELFDEKRKESIVMPPGGVVDEWIDKKREIHGNVQRW